MRRNESYMCRIVGSHISLADGCFKGMIGLWWLKPWGDTQFYGDDFLVENRNMKGRHLEFHPGDRTVTILVHLYHDAYVDEFVMIYEAGDEVRREP